MISKDIPDYEGMYAATKCGKVWSHKRNIWLKPVLSNTGYVNALLYKDKKPKCFRIHRLILLTFIGPSNLQCNHKNAIKTDNRLSNLEYCTAKENINHAIRMGLQVKAKGQTHYSAKLKELDVLFIRHMIEQGERPKDIVEMYGIHRCNIRHIVKRITWKHI